MVKIKIFIVSKIRKNENIIDILLYSYFKKNIRNFPWVKKNKCTTVILPPPPLFSHSPTRNIAEYSIELYYVFLETPVLRAPQHHCF